MIRNITDEGPWRVRYHHGFGHGLRPGEDRDMNCPSCQVEDAPRGTFAGLEVAVVTRDNSGPFPRVRVAYLASRSTPWEWVAADAVKLDEARP